MIDLLQQLRKTPQGMGAEYQTHVAVGSAHLVGHLFLLGHTAAQADYLPGIGLFGMGQGAEISIDPLLGVLPHGAGVEDDHIGLMRILGKSEAQFAEHAHNMFAVGHVLLASKSVYAGQGRMIQGFLQMRADLLHDLPLPRQLLGGYNDFFSLQKTFSCLPGRKRPGGKSCQIIL